jgi:HlyD family secretion protein
MFMKKIFIISGILIVIVAVYFIFFRSKSINKVEYNYAEIKKGSIIQEITATGTLNALKTIDVGTQVSGKVSKIYVDFNDEVKKGQVIAMIDTVNLVSSVVDAEASVLKAKTDLIQQQKEFDRYSELLAKKAVSQSDFDAVNTEYLSAKIALKSAETQLDRAKTNLEYATITAPIDGIVISRAVDEGQTVAASFSTPTLFTIANDLRKMQLKASIDEADIGLIKKEQEVSFSVDAYPDQKFTGTVQQIRLQPTTSQNVVTYTVVIDVPNPDLKLLPGMSATLSVKVDEHKDILIVPMAAVLFNPETTITTKTSSTNVNKETMIWIKCEKQDSQSKEYNGVFMKPLAVKVGVDDGTNVEISGDNIKEGIKVAIGIKDVAAEKTKSLLSPPENKKGGPPAMMN